MTTIKRNAKTIVIAFLVGIIALSAGVAVAHNDGTEIRITAILGGSRVVIRSVDYSSEAHTLTMRVTGLSEAMGNLTCYSS